MINMNENSFIEFKRELNDKFEKEVVSFLNANGGHIYIGVEDDSTIYGVQNIDQVQLEIKDRIKDKVSPSPVGFFEIVVEEKNDISYIHVIVAAGNEKPYYIKKYGMCPQGAFIRVGSSYVALTEKQIFDLYSKRTRTSLINILSPVQELSFTQLKIYYESIGYIFTQNTFRQLNFLFKTGEFNYLAYLLSDQNALVINVGKFKGNDVIELEEMKTYQNQSLIKTTFEIVNLIDNYNKVFTTITSSKKIEKRLFDPIAMREAVINDLVHSDYTYENTPTFRIFDNRIEIISVGGLPEGLEKTEFLNGYMSPKNPQLMKIFRDLGLVEHMGTGIIRILSKYDASVFTFSSNFIKVSIPFSLKDRDVYEHIDSEYNNIELSLRQKNIVELIKENKFITQEEIGNLLGVSRFTIIREIKILENKGIIKRKGSNKTGEWVIDL